jgi:hypothetical protein
MEKPLTDSRSPERQMSRISEAQDQAAFRAAFPSQIPPPLLLPLQRHKQGLEIPDAKPPAPVAFDHLKEQRRPILHRLRKDLQQVAFVIQVDNR